MTEKKSKDELGATPTSIDRELEKLARELIANEATDYAEYERLLSLRERRLVRLPSPRKLGPKRWFKEAV